MVRCFPPGGFLRCSSINWAFLVPIKEPVPRLELINVFLYVGVTTLPLLLNRPDAVPSSIKAKLYVFASLSTKRAFRWLYAYLLVTKR